MVRISALRVSLRARDIRLTDEELMNSCKALAQLVGDSWVEVFEDSVAISQRSDKILTRLSETLRQLPDGDIDGVFHDDA